jgi:hypothetical protein
MTDFCRPVNLVHQTWMDGKSRRLGSCAAAVALGASGRARRAYLEGGVAEVRMRFTLTVLF